ncbi:MAG TPA: hypothetical protein VHC95_07015 [Opitutales bacterium]|nr:hypothetical protein [Opitutales bacterium]
MKSKHVIIRTRSAGVFAGELDNLKDNTAELKNARRLWYWDGAATLSQLSVEGTKKPGNCKFPCKVPSVILPEVIEVLPLSDAARASIDGVPVWSA